MRNFVLCVWLVVGCAAGGDSVAVQAVAGPGGVTVTERAAGELAVSWAADPAASQYRLWRSTGGTPSLVATVFDSAGGKPSTSYIDTGLASGILYCYSVQSLYPGPAASDIGAATCATAGQAATPPRQTHTYKLSPLSGANVGAGAFQVQAGKLTGNWSPAADGDLLGVQLAVQAGERFESIAASVYGNSAYTVTMTMLAQDDAFHVGADLGHRTSVAQNSTQTLTITATEDVTTTPRSYWLQFRAMQVGTPDGGSPFVGPITLTTSTPL